MCRSTLSCHDGKIRPDRLGHHFSRCFDIPGVTILRENAMARTPSNGNNDLTAQPSFEPAAIIGSDFIAYCVPGH